MFILDIQARSNVQVHAGSLVGGADGVWIRILPRDKVIDQVAYFEALHFTCGFRVDGGYNT